MKHDGSQVRRVAHRPERDDYACWIDNDRLAIIGERERLFDIFVVGVK